ncbi:HAD family phosphatase [Streptomyces sp. MK37H]|uniref:HAD family hydrolase n=1 Tax=Streptomyces sp. MK37H TaxID=2699117 RepID=UPI001B37CB61|nr:HAD family phosphatase [Streptomyces sp. MK37H]MBP8535363.1 HAD-IA family hydrolase [Streptomyces sp. MK37H]
MKSAAIFDLDGTLVDRGLAYFSAERDTLAHFGYEGLTAADHSLLTGMGTKEMWEEITVTRGMDVSPAELLECSNRFYLRRVREGVRVFSEVVELARLLRDAGFAIAVASGSSQEVIQIVLSCAGLDDLFPARVSAEEVQQGKSEPFVFLEASRLLSVEPDRCSVVEDASVGVEAGLRAGMRCVAATAAAALTHPRSACAGQLLLAEREILDARAVLRWIAQRSRPSEHDG